MQSHIQIYFNLINNQLIDTIPFVCILQFFSVANKRLSNQLSHFQNSKHN